MIDDAIGLVTKFGPWGIAMLLIFYMAMFPERAEKFGALMWKFMSIFFRRAGDKYIKHDIQGSVNNFVVSELAKEIKDFEAPKIKVEWVNSELTAEQFISNNKMIVRMKQSSSQEENIVRASMVYISKALLIKAKAYISPKQKEALNLHTARRLLQKEKPKVLETFTQQYLIDKNNTDEKLRTLLRTFEHIDQAGLFFPVLVQELNFLGNKVFGQPRDSKIIQETAHLIKFLDDYSTRVVGEDSEMEFYGEYMSFGIVLIGSSKLVARNISTPYIKAAEMRMNDGADSIYLIGANKNRDLMNIAANKLVDQNKFHIYSQKDCSSIITFSDDTKQKVKSYLIVLRRTDTIMYHPD